MTETAAGGYGAAIDYQALHQATVRLPQLDAAELEHGRYVPVPGANPYLPSAEQRDREREAASRLFERMQAVERAAIQAGQAALEAGATADRIMAEAATAADKAVSA